MEAKEGYYFIDECLGEYVEELYEDNINKIKHGVKAAHGYLPIRDKYKTFFVASGREIKSGIVLDDGKLINHGPTIAKLMGIKLNNVDGKVEERIFNI